MYVGVTRVADKKEKLFVPALNIHKITISQQIGKTCNRKEAGAYPAIA
jgi:hypothetical protein